MKKIILPAVMFVIAIAGAFATNVTNKSMFTTFYIKPTATPTQCNAVVCDATGTKDCFTPSIETLYLDNICTFQTTTSLKRH